MSYVISLKRDLLPLLEEIASIVPDAEVGAGEGVISLRILEPSVSEEIREAYHAGMLNVAKTIAKKYDGLVTVEDLGDSVSINIRTF